MGSTTREPLLDELVWCNPYFIAQWGPLHNNTVLMYFADSPWCDPTSNNKTIMAQALYNPNLAAVVGTREAFEAHLKSMSGLEYVVAEAPAETGPGMGTGVWVIRKQTRKKRGGNLDDEITVHADYFVIGENIYAAPSFADIMGSRLVSGNFCLLSIPNAEPRIPRRPPSRIPLRNYSSPQTVSKNGHPHVVIPLQRPQYPALPLSSPEKRHL